MEDAETHTGVPKTKTKKEDAETHTGLPKTKTHTNSDTKTPTGARAKTHKTHTGKEDIQTHTGVTRTKTHKNNDTKNPTGMRGKTHKTPTSTRAKSHAERRANTDDRQDKPGQAKSGTEAQRAKDAETHAGVHKTHSDPLKTPTRELAMEDTDGGYYNNLETPTGTRVKTHKTPDRKSACRERVFRLV